MRKLKFRVWDNLKKAWVTNKRIHTINTDETGYGYLQHPDGFTIEQFIGLKDKNGKEIYEGDIVKATWKENNPYGYFPKDWDENEDIIFVKYSAPSFNLQQRYGDGGQICIEDFKWEIIGNIHENPELLK